ncbi:hypothetical protein NDU88_006864 [Pleurodeles waltl]|uniref:Uncharacterized protein n=1 Tax=Pleurodeles waltl TaxID=8319 RepID=A0AAV7QK16_PLEWA|nr:hypothetical protein NDU88_006864 [Pleurodeles waltl]
MASGNSWNLTPPQPFISVSGTPTLKWEEWCEYFKNYISAIDDEEELSAEKKYKILLHCLGPGGLKVFKNINKKLRQDGQGDLYSNALEDLDNYYGPRVCVAVDRYKFFHRKQGKDEPVEDYVAALKNLAINCKFGILHDELIRDQIVMQASNSSIQDNLWAKGESSLQEIIDIVKRAELTGRCAKEILNENKSDESIVARVKGKRTLFEHKKKWPGKPVAEQKNHKLDERKKVEAVYDNSVRLSDGKIRHMAVLSLCKRTSDTRQGSVRDGQIGKEWLEDEMNVQECVNQG